MWLYGGKPLKVSYDPVKYDGHKQCSSGDILVLVSLRILQDHVTKGSSNSVSKSSFVVVKI